MALMARSIEMSFSLSRLRRTLRSMSIRAPPVTGPRPPCLRPACLRPACLRPLFLWLLAVSARARFAKLHLYPARPQLGVGELTVAAVHLQRDPRVTGRNDTPADLRGL